MPILLLVLGVAGVVWLWQVSESEARLRRKLVASAQDLLAFFNRNNGVDIARINNEQTVAVQRFQIDWNYLQRELNKPELQLRNDGAWESLTQNRFMELTGYVPSPKT